MTEILDRSNRWKQKLMRSFRISEHLQEMIKSECQQQDHGPGTERNRGDFSALRITAA
jgi:hypothetical protein